MTHSLMRSALFVPADRPSAIAKAGGLGADILVLDLEDAVAAETKAEARKNVPSAIEQFKASGAVTALRINEPGSDALADDLAVFGSTRPDAVVIAKLQAVEHLRAVRAQLHGAGYDGPIWSMIETAKGIIGLETMIEQVSLLSLELVMVGVNDLAKSLKIPEGPDQRAALEPHIARILLAARAAEIPVLDGVYNAHKDSEGFQLDAEIGRTMGFDGKCLIHPSQVGIANAVFAPTDDEIAWAKAVVEAYAQPENEGKGAISVQGRMVEHLHLKSARTVLAAAEQAAQR